MPAEGRRTLGDLEALVLEMLWTSGGTLSVRDVLARVKRKPPLAYTTILTVLDRLHEKGFVAREKQGRAFRYWPGISRERWLGEEAAQVLTGSPARVDGAVLMAFLDSAERADPGLLDQLSVLIAARRKRGRA